MSLRRLLTQSSCMALCAAALLCCATSAWCAPDQEASVASADAANPGKKDGSLMAADTSRAAEPSDAISRFLSSSQLISTATNSPPVKLIKDVSARASNMASDLVVSAMNFIGVPYKYGGQTSEGGFDCSGFTRYVYEHSVGLILPRRADEQAKAAGMVEVKRDDLQPGDLVFFRTLKHAFSHVGIYIGDHRFIHSPRSGAEVRIEDMQNAYWSSRFNGARRAGALNDEAIASTRSTDGGATAPSKP